MNIKETLTTAFYKTSFCLKKHAPEIMIVGGVAGTVVSTVLACKATTKAGAIADEHKEKMATIHEAEMVAEDGEYTEKDKRKDTAIVYTQTAMKYAKLYAPAVITGALSVTSILAGTHILKKRSLAYAAAYAMVDKGFKEYRDRVAERFGEEVEREIRYNIRDEEVEEEVTDKKGNKKTVKKKVKTSAEPSIYARFFDESCFAYSRCPEDNLNFIRMQQDNANDILKRRKYLFLNEVYRMIGLPPTKEGQVIGWYIDETTDHPSHNYVDFGFYNMTGNVTQDERKRAFVNGHESSILLEFNVDGNILDRL